nr:unnamed protein product [Callosobruchus analis]
MSWKFFEAGHGKGAADGIGGALKRQADAIVARGQDIADAVQLFSALQNASKVKLFLATDERRNRSSNYSTQRRASERNYASPPDVLRNLCKFKPQGTELLLSTILLLS